MTYIPEVYHNLIKIPGFESSIVAGGYVRDKIMGGPITDLDIFIPMFNQEDFKAKVATIPEGLMKVGDFLDGEAYIRDNDFLGKFDANDGELDIDLVGYRWLHPTGVGFERLVLESFNFNIDRSYSRGHYPVSFPEATRDMENMRATWSRVSEMDNVDNSTYMAFHKFSKLQKKYENIKLGTSLRISNQGE